MFVLSVQQIACVWFPCISTQFYNLLLISSAYYLKNSGFYSHLPTDILCLLYHLNVTDRL